MDGNSMKLIGLGGAFALGGLWLIMYAYAKMRRCSARTFGRIVRVEEKRNCGKNGQQTRYKPVVEYVVDGRTFGPVTGNVYSTSKRDYVVGNSIKIRYNPNKPEEFIVAIGGAFIAGLGILTLGGTLICLGLNEMAAK
mgnify:CR=1 FL=1